MTQELASLRQRLAKAQAEATRLQGERTTLAGSIADLGVVVEKTRTAEMISAPAERPGGSPIDSAEAMELGPMPGHGLVMDAGRAGQDAVAALSGKLDSDHLQLRAELALAQLEIANLSADLASARANYEALEAEADALRSLTDDRIRRLFGWERPVP